MYLPGGQEISIGKDGAITGTRYYSFAGATVAVRTGAGLGGVTSLVNDHHGTPIAAIPNTTWSATSVQRLYTDPFGATRGPSTATTVPGETQFLGKTRDEATGLTLLGARYYDETLGAFLSVDPLLDLTDPAQWNPYAYAAANPLTRADPSGLLALGGTDTADIRGKSFTGTGGGTVTTATDVIKPPVKPGLWGTITGWVDDHQSEIAGFVAGTIVTGGCLAVTAGAGSILCAGLGGAAGGAVTNLWAVNVAQTQEFSWGSLAIDTGLGGAFGLGGGAGGALISKAVASAAKPAAGSAAKAVACTFNSFTPGTAVLMADGTHEAIEDIEIGDQVQATDPVTGERGSRAVTDVIIGDGEKDLTTITVGNDASASGEVVATDGHPFWAPERGRWVDAGDLLPGDRLATSAGTLVQVNAIQHDHREQTVYNLAVAGLHTYHVLAGNDAILVHNCAPAANAAHTGVSAVPIGPAPEKAWSVLNRVDAKGSPLAGYKGGRVFENAQGRLPEDPSVTYREWDVNPYIKGVNRGAERIVTGSDGSAYWTGDHYGTFVMFRGATR